MLERISCKIGMPITNEEGKTQIEIPLNADAFVYSTGRRYGYVTHQTRPSADPNEYLSPIQDGEWWKQIESGEQDCEIRFECRPVSPLEVNVIDTAGNPVEATVEVTNAAWATQATVWWEQSDSSGRLTIPLRPVVFKVNIEAKTEDGRSGRVDNFELSKDFERVETVQIKVK